METLFNAIYNCIYGLGLVTGKIFGGFFRKTVSVIKKIFRFNRKSFSSSKAFLKRSVAVVLIVAVIGGVAFAVYSNSNKTAAVTLEIDDEIVGYATSQTEADLAEAEAIRLMGSTGSKTIKNNSVRVDAHNVKSVPALAEILVSKLSAGLTLVNESYIDDELL